MTSRSNKTEHSKRLIEIERYQTVLCDLDGCLISGDTVLPGARELIGRCGDRMYVFSNNSTDTVETLSTRLADLGIHIAAERILLAGVAAVNHVAERFPAARVCIHGSEAIVAYAQSLGITIESEQPDVILVTRDINFSYDKLSRVIDGVYEGAHIVVSNPDTTHPRANGRPVPETGSLLKWISSCLPDLKYTVIGKPEANLYQMALRLANTKAQDCLCIGDNESTDGEGARRMGMDFALVRHGTDPISLLDILGNH